MKKLFKENFEPERLFFRRFLPIFFFLLLTNLQISALDRERSISQFHHTSWTVKDGAPSQISALAQTSDGFLWIGSALGLYRFDGVQFERYSPPDGVKFPAINIYALLATSDGGLWISFRPSGLGFLKDGKLKVFTHPEELPTSQVYCFAQTDDGRIWAGTHDGLAYFNGSGWAQVGADWDFTPGRVRSFFVDREHNLWVSKDDSIAFMPSGTQTFLESETKNNVPLQISQDLSGRLWITGYNSDQSSKDSLSLVFGEKISKLNPNTDTSQLFIDRDGALWFSEYRSGIRRLPYPEKIEKETVNFDDPEIQSFIKKDGLSGEGAGIFLEDREGNIWVGSMNGLDRFRYSAIAPVELPDDFHKLTLLPGENGEVWVASAAKKTILRVGKINSPPIELAKTQVSSFFRDANGNIWWGGHGGIFHQSAGKIKYYPHPADLKPDFIWELFRGDGDGGVWVNYGDDGLIYFKDGVWSRRKPPEGLPNRGPSASFHDDGGRVWLGYTENRVFVLDNGQVKGYLSKDGVEIGRVKIIRGRGNNIWIGGELGLGFLKGDRFYTVRTNGEQLETISGIIETASGDLWLNTNKGIISISSTEIAGLKDNPDYKVNYRLFDFNDNLPGNPQMNFTVSTAVESSDGKLWFATDKGLAQIDPAKLTKNKLPPPIVIKTVQADDKIYQPGQELVFPAGTQNLRIDFSGVSLSIPERVQYKYRLEGFDTEWRDGGNHREAYYTNLAPGNYRFQVISANNDGVWNNNGAVLELTILPKFYQTNWFLLVCFALCLFLFWLGYKWRVHQLRERLNFQFQERLSERTRIARDLHDTLLQGFVSAKMQLYAEVQDLPPEIPKTQRLKDVYALLGELIEDGRNTIKDLRATEFDNLTDFEQEFLAVKKEFDIDCKIDCRIVTRGKPRLLHPIVSQELVNIGREALINAFLHAQPSVIEVEIEYTPKMLRLMIHDNGCGIDPKILEKGRERHWGLIGMRERAEKIKAKIRIWSRINLGTEVEVSVPQQVAFKRNRFFPI
jgi:signal transduction histidine kinase/ligand-binding sensor domain-containing protein